MKTKILAGAAALAFAAGGFALGRTTAPEPVDCLVALEAADSTITALTTAPDADRVSEIDYPTHRDACKEAIG